MRVIPLSLRKQALKNQMKNVTYSQLLQAAQDLGNEAAQKEIHKYAGQIGSAILIACKEIFGAGIGRMSKFTEVLNENIPDWLQFKIDPNDFKQKKARTKLNDQQLYDLAECLLAVNCNRSCNKNPAKCELRKMMKEKEIPEWDENGKCEYKIDLKVV